MLKLEGTVETHRSAEWKNLSLEKLNDLPIDYTVSGQIPKSKHNRLPIS
jgi:hypothetical protein